MFDIAMVRFLTDAESGKVTRDLGRARDYEYRIPDFLNGKVEKGMLAIVSIKDTGSKINSTVVEIVAVKNVLDGDYSGDHAYLVGVVDPEPFAEIERADRRRKRLLDLIKQEKERLVGEMDLSQLSSLSPTMAQLVAELQGVNEGKPMPRTPAIAPDWAVPRAAPMPDPTPAGLEPNN